MTIFSVIFAISGIIVYSDVRKSNSRRDMAIYITLMIVSLLFAIFYFRDPYQRSLIEIFMGWMR